MAAILRLKRWTTYADDGKSSASFTIPDKKQVAVFIGLGLEPADLTTCPEDKMIDVDDIILKLAAEIRKSRKEKKAANKSDVPV